MMKLRHALLGILILTPLASLRGNQTPVPAAPTTAPAIADEAFVARLAAIDAKAGAVSDLTADFEQHKYSPLLRDPIITRGTIRSKGAAMLWQSDEPEATRTRVDTDRLRIFYVKRNVVEEYPIAGKLGSLAASPLPRLATLRERFTIIPDSGEGLPVPAGVTQAVALRLDPAEEDVKQYVGHVRVLLDETRGLVVTFEVTDPDDERTTISFSNLRPNTNVADADLDLKAPANAQIVRPLEPGR